MNPYLLVFAATTMLVFVFTLAWWWARACHNYSLVDAFWAAGLATTGLNFLLLAGAWNEKKCIAALLFGCWSIRLSWHLGYRIAKDHPHEDRRYQALREAWKDHEGLLSFLFFQAQALSVVLLTLPFLLIGMDENTRWNFLQILGIFLLGIGILGEALADAQLASYKKNNHDPLGVCQTGLWKYSRHPNYFFEIVIWISFYLIASTTPGGWMTLYAPATMIFLLLKITGIPPSEASSLQSKGVAYRRYQQTTSVIIPWFPKKS